MMNGDHPVSTNGPVSNKKVLQNTELPSQILAQLNECRLEKQFTDVILSVDAEELHCHR